jgi:hypothetical protein
MGIKKIKKENNSINISLVDLIGKLDNSETKKYTQFLVKILKKNFDNEQDFLLRDLSHRERKIDQVLTNSTFDGWITRKILTNLYGWDEVDSFIDFCNFMERGLTNEKDISKYDSWEMVTSEVFQAKNRNLFKMAKKEVKVVYEDDQYMCIKPLTYVASVSYGYQTRWCTASVQEPSYFYNHSKDGVLVYLIDKINNVKFGFYHNSHQIQIYNQKDDRVDSMETGIPVELLHKLIGEMKSEAKDKNFNYKLFGESELENMKKYRGNDTMVEPVRMDEMLTEGPMDEMMVEIPTNEEVSEYTGLRIDTLEDMRERVRRLRHRNPLEIGDDLP